MKRFLNVFGSGLFVVLMAVSLNLVSAATLFSDNFDDGNANGWTTQNGTWSVVSDSGSPVYYQSSSSEGRASAGQASWTNYAVESKVKVDNFNGSNRVMVCARYKDGNNFYAATLYNSSGGTLEIRKKVGGSSSTLATTKYTLATGTWYTVKLEVSGTSIKMYVNGALQLSATDSALSAGGIGFVTKSNTKFDNVTVSDSSSSTTSTPPSATPSKSPSATVTPTKTPSPTTSVSPSVTPSTSPVVSSGDLFVGPNGSASNSGTQSSPLTLDAAVTRIAAGKTIYLLSGTYNLSSTITIAYGNNGTASALKTITGYNGAVPVLNFSAMAFASTNRGIQLFGNYWKVKGITVEYAGDNGMLIGGSHNTVENCEIRFNRDAGLQIARYASTVTSINDWPSYNLVLNCYSHDNFDPDNGEDADGFACKLTAGYGNVFRGCISAYNIDDGWDLYTKSETGPIGPVTLENCVAYNNGAVSNGGTTASSDGNGFKLGGDKIQVNHIVKRCVAFNNKKHGFTYNSNPGSISLTNCTSYNNGTTSGSNFAFDAGTHSFTNCLSFTASSSDKISGTDVSGSNVWWINKKSTSSKNLVCSAADFVSLTPSVTRNADGSPNLGNFLKLVQGSDLVNAGIPSGTDIGAFECY